MSSVGEGVVLALPLVAVGVGAAGVAMAAVAVAGAGVVVVREGARTIVACGREMKAMASENLAMQRALRAAAQRYEADLRRQELERLRLHGEQIQARIAAHRQDQAKRAQVMAEIQTQMASASADSKVDWATIDRLREQMLAVAPVATDSQANRLNLLSGWPQRVQLARDLADHLGALLWTYTSGADQGLFRTTPLERLLDEVRSQLSPLEAQANQVLIAGATPDAGTLEQVLAELTYLDRRLGELRVQVPQRRKQRQDALEAIMRAQQALDRTVGSVQTGDQIAGLDIAAQTLDDALKAIAECEFHKAQIAASAVLSHLEMLEQAAVRQRQQNLALLLASMRERVTPLGALDSLKADVDAWAMRCRACETQAESDLEAAWREADELAKQADQLQEGALAILLRHSADSFVDVAQKALQDMGYEVEMRPAEPGMRSLIGRQGNRRVYVTLSETGEVQLKFDGYGDTSCQEAQREFLARIKAQGVIGAWQQRFTLTDAVQRLVHTLLQSGMDVRVEPSDDGVTVLASGRPDISTAVNYDGAVEASEKWREQVRRGQLEDPQEILIQKQKQFYEYMQSIRLQEFNR